MDQDKELQQLIDFVQEQSITVKYDRGNFMGGVVRYREDGFLYLNRKDDPGTKIKTILSELPQLPVPEAEWPAAIKEIIKKYS